MRQKFNFKRRQIPFKRGAAILPSLFTLGNMFLGYVAIILAYKGDIENAVNLVLLAGILDTVDGRIARMTGTSSDFGRELDSLADFLSFGIAPALILYFWGFSELGRLGWLFVFLLPVGGAIRLARFNIQAQVMDKRFFVGLPIPAAAAAAVFPLYFLDADFLDRIRNSSHVLLLTLKTSALMYVVVVAFFMVSRIKYRSFKELDARERKPAPFFFFVALFVVAVVIWYQLVLLVTSIVYLLSGPAALLVEKLKKPSHPDRASAEESSDVPA
jgi:CDP-diacylglycerol---serine O-phosphatidyltransferase